jgi:hypothetical protein
MSADFTFPPRNTSDDFNPYAPPEEAIEVEPIDLISTSDLAAAESVRKAYIGHEASVKSIGTLHYLGAFMVLLGAVILFANALSGQVPGGPLTRGFMIGLSVVYFAMSGMHLALGIGLTRLRSWARWTEVVLISLVLSLYGVVAITNVVMEGKRSVLVGIFLGSAILGYILYLLVSARATTVFSPEYKTIITQTPHIKYRTSLFLKLLLVLMVMMFTLAIVGTFIGRLV